MPDVMNISVSALRAFSRQLATTSHNIANVQNEGFSRQRVDYQALAPAGNLGAGVEISAVRRAFDQFATDQMRDTGSSLASMDTYATMLQQLEAVMSDPGSSLGPAMNDFFNTLQELANDPVSGSTRQLTLSRADELVERFHLLSGYLQKQEFMLDQDIGVTVERINVLSANIASLNGSIAQAVHSISKTEPSDLLDQRDRLLQELSGLVRIRAAEQPDGTVNVFTGSGQVLALGQQSFTLNTRAGAFGQGDLEITYSGVSEITSLLEGGRLGGLLQARNDVMEPQLRELGRVALALSDRFNALHAQGMDKNGALGADFFGRPAIQAKAASGNGGNLVLSVTVADLTAIKPVDYQLQVNAASELIVSNLTDGSVTNLGSGAGPFTVDGLQIAIAGGAANAGDRFLLQPTRDMAAGLALAITDPAAIAAANPVASAAAIDNAGSGKISAARITDIGNPAFTASAGRLSPPLAVRFLNASTYEILDNTNPLAPLVLESGLPYTPGAELLPSVGGLDYGYRVQIGGAPQGGDLFTLDYNSGGVGDNQNALQLAGLAAQPLLDGGSKGLLDAHNEQLAGLGARVFSASNNRQVFSVLHTQATARRDSVAGVNLDEEAADMLRFQQAYEAAAQAIRIAESMFQTLLNAVNPR